MPSIGRAAYPRFISRVGWTARSIPPENSNPPSRIRSGLTPVYLEGALERALHPAGKLAAALPDPAVAHPRSHAAPPVAPPVAESVLNPFSVYRKGEALLRRQLAALSGWHLVNIIQAHGLSQQDAAALAATADDVLVELIVSEVRARSEHVTR